MMRRMFRTTATLIAGLVLTTTLNAASFYVTSANDSGPGTLRQAILDANASPGPDSVSSLGAMFVVRPTQALPVISDPVELSLIVLDGVNAGDVSGLVFTNGGHTIRRVVVVNFRRDGIVLRAGAKNRVMDVLVGVDTNQVSGPIGGNGIVIEDNTETQLGGIFPDVDDSVSTHVVVSECARNGILVTGGSRVTIASATVGEDGGGARGHGLSGIRVADSEDLRFGSEHGGVTAAGNSLHGIELVRVKNGDLRGVTAGRWFRGTGNDGHGFFIQDSSGLAMRDVGAEGNAEDGFRLLRVANSTLLSLRSEENTLDGVRLIASSGNTFGDTTRPSRIRGNGNHGLELTEGSNRNLIRTSFVWNNHGTGLLISDSSENEIGIVTGNSFARSLFAGNEVGIAITGTASTGNLVYGNRVGEVEDFSQPTQGNRTAGILITGGASGNTIGGAGDRANSLTSNGAAGVSIESGSRNRIVSNEYMCNGGKAIELSAGANEGQVPPSVDLTYSTLNLIVEGTVRGKPATDYAVELYRTGNCGAASPIDIVTVTTGTDGMGSFRYSRQVTTVGVYTQIAATATDPAGNTSELSASTRVLADNNYVAFSKAAYAVSERIGQLPVTIVRLGPVDWAASVSYRTVDGQAKAGSDYTATTGTVTFAVGERSKTVTIPILSDAVPDAGEQFRLELFASTNELVFLIGTPYEATVTIQEGTPSVSIADAAAGERDTDHALSLLVTPSFVSHEPITVTYRAEARTATEGEDFTAISGQAVIEPGAAQAIISIPVRGDYEVEDDETFAVVLTNAAGAQIADGEAAALLRNDDGVPVIHVGDARVLESKRLRITLTRTALNGRPSQVNVRARGGTAGPHDFEQAQRTVLFEPEETSKTIEIFIGHDLVREGDETFLLDLDDPVNAVLAREEAVITIDDDGDTQLAVEVAADPVAEGAASHEVLVPIRLSSASDTPVTVQYQMIPDTAAAGSDYEPATGTVVFAPGETSKQIPIRILGDSIAEDVERFTLRLDSSVGFFEGPVAIANDDGPALRIEDAVLVENARETTLSVTLDAPAPISASVDVDIDYGTAGAADFNMPLPTRLLIASGQRTATLEIRLHNDVLVEPDERFTVRLSNPGGVRIAEGEAVVTIRDDDSGDLPVTLPGVRIHEARAEESNALRFVVELSRPHDTLVVVELRTVNGTAGTADYRPETMRLIFEPGQTRKDVLVDTFADTQDEGLEWVFLAITDTAQATIETPAGVGRIYDPGQQPRRRRSVAR